MKSELGTPLTRADWEAVWMAGEDAFRQFQRGQVDEQAGPAYFRGLRLSRMIFRQRLLRALQAVALQGLCPQETSRCLDFGCGFGLAMPFLAKVFDQVVGVDLHLEPSAAFFRELAEKRPKITPSSTTVVSSLDELSIAEQGSPAKFDAVLALDVFEHIEPLEPVLDQIQQLLKPTGKLIVSGPTESWWYRLGRKVVGFSGDYHVSDIYTIEQQLQQAFQVRRVASVPRLPVLFEILEATPQQKHSTT